MASHEQVKAAGGYYDDDAHFFAARQFPGCFTVAQVRAALGQPGPGQPSSDDVEPVEPVEPDRTLNGHGDGHFLPGCACTPLHAQCGDPNPKQGVGCKVSFTPEQLRVAADAGCLFCRAIYGGILAAPPWDPSRKTPIPMMPSIELNSARWNGQDAGMMLFQPRGPPVMMYIDGKTTELSPCWMFHVREDLPSTADAEDIIAYIQGYSKDCDEKHSCAPLDSSFRPTRLVQVGVKDGKYTVKLVLGAKTTDKYLTLSHCWGTNMPASAKTLSSSLQRNFTDIPWEGLTQTFRDAVAMTERLGYTQIWIDSLCIIQDSRTDWEAEASMMGQVYANCDLMFSADGASDGSVGFFRSAQISSRPWWSKDTKGTMFDALRFAYIKFHRTFGQMAQMFVSPEEWAHLCPLDSRAWCYQERRLAPRIIHFGVDELHWDYQRGGLCQCGAFGNIPFPTDRAQMHRAKTNAVSNRAEKEQLWDQAVAGYGERSLTIWTDRLPALSGLAKRFLPRLKFNSESQLATVVLPQEEAAFDDISLGSYLAGLWSGYLNRGLCWSASREPGRRVSTPAHYIAPSWSWMSVSGQAQVLASKDFEPVAEIVSAGCTPSGADTMGEITYGEVILRAKVIPLWAYRGIVGDGSRAQRMVYIHIECVNPRNPAERVCPGTFRPDTAPTLEGHISDARFFADSNFCLSNPSVRGKDLDPLNDGTYYGVHVAKKFIMVIRPVSGGERATYERVGCVLMSGFGAETSDKSEFFDGTEPNLIKLV